MEREVEAGIGMVNTCKSIADSCQCMDCKVVSLQLIKINEKKEKKEIFLPKKQKQTNKIALCVGKLF